MDRDTAKLLAACVLSILVMVVLIGSRLREEPAREVRRARVAPSAAGQPPVHRASGSTASASGAVRHVDHEVSAFAAAQFDALAGGDAASDDEDAEDAADEEADEAALQKKIAARKKRGRKKRGRKAINRRLQDPDDAEDDGKDDDDPNGENAKAERMDRGELERLIQAEDKESAAEDEPLDEILGVQE